MNKNFPEILKDFPHTRFVSDEDITPFYFYEKYLPHSKEIWLKFGYFSTNAIRTLSLSFARFIYKGGNATIITNHFYNKTDADELINNNLIDFEIEDQLNSTEGIRNLLEGEKQHFYNCLRYLQNKRRLKIQPVIKKNGKMAHFKEGVFEDYDGNYIGFNGSCNFTHSGIMVNGESLDFKAEWELERNKTEIHKKKDEINSLINGKDSNYDLLDKNGLEIVIKTKGQKKELVELLEFEGELHKKRNKKLKGDGIYEEILREYKKEESQPKFPFDEPRNYQKDAYKAWIKNEYKGLFAMATGTGKTITSLNCILNEYKKTGNYSTIILVPTTSLAIQWEEELDSFNFKNVINQSNNNNWKEELKHAKNAFTSIQRNFIFISTYTTFFKDEIFYLLNDEKICDNLILISDECHALGTTTALKKLNSIKIQKRIGLSATPNRQYDNFGTNEICRFFNTTQPKYTYFYSMGQAINNGVLCKFDYFPQFVSLEKDELDEYYSYTVKLRRYIDTLNGGYKKSKEAEMLLIQRKNIIHKAKLKIPLMKDIIQQLGINKFKAAFVYVPEGFYPDYDSMLSDDDFKDDNNRLIVKYSKLLGDSKLRVRLFNGNTPKKKRVKILKDFENGTYDALISMKCLDEGIDVPNAKLAVFCSSTGNPRQFVQRRGRVLRTYKNQKAKIFDMIVKPDFQSITNEADYNSEVNIFKSELIRIINFLALADNKNQIINNQLEALCKSVGINNIYELINNELKKH